MTEQKEEISEQVSEKIELLAKLMGVSSSIKENVTSDYTLASFSKDEREFITENYQNAEFAKEIISRFANKGYKYTFDDKKGDWVRDSEGSVQRIELSEKEKTLIMSKAVRIFTFFMISPHMMAILNRNKTENFLVKLLGRSDDEEEKPVMYNADDRSILQKIKDKLSGEEKYEEE